MGSYLEPCSDHCCIMIPASERGRGMGTNGGCRHLKVRGMEAQKALREMAEAIHHDRGELIQADIDAMHLRAEVERLAQRQAWLDAVSRPTHPEDERPWSSAYLDARAEVERLRAALDAAATSLESLGNAGRPEQPLLADCVDVRAFARNRAIVARAALEGKT